MCVIGYDDDKYGGAFEIMNSWGTDWGNDGYMWIHYSDFQEFVNSAFELIPKKKGKTIRLDGEISLESGVQSYDVQKLSNRIPSYKVTSSLKEGDEFQIHLSNKNAAYVYAIGLEEGTTDPSVLFPLDNNTSALLNYSENIVVLPSEEYSIQISSSGVTDYLVVFFSKEPLDIHSLIGDLAIARGDIYRKLQTLENYILYPTNLPWDEASFVLETSTQENKFVPIVVELHH